MLLLKLSVYLIRELYMHCHLAGYVTQTDYVIPSPCSALLLPVRAERGPGSTSTAQTDPGTNEGPTRIECITQTTDPTSLGTTA